MELIDVFVNCLPAFLNDFRDYQSLMNTCRQLRVPLYLRPTMACLHLKNGKTKSIWQQMEEFKYNHLVLCADIIIETLPKFKCCSVNSVTVRLDELFPLVRVLKLDNKLLSLKECEAEYLPTRNKLSIIYPKTLRSLSLINIALYSNDYKRLQNLSYLDIDYKWYLNSSFTSQLDCLVYKNVPLEYCLVKSSATITILYCHNNQCIISNFKGSHDIKFLPSLKDKEIAKLKQKINKTFFVKNKFIVYEINNRHYCLVYIKDLSDIINLEYRRVFNIFPHLEMFT